MENHITAMRSATPENLETNMKSEKKEKQQNQSGDGLRAEDNDQEFLGDTCNFLWATL